MPADTRKRRQYAALRRLAAEIDKAAAYPYNHSDFERMVREEFALCRDLGIEQDILRRQNQSAEMSRGRADYIGRPS